MRLIWCVLVISFLFSAEQAIGDVGPARAGAGRELDHPQDVLIRGNTPRAIFTDRQGHTLYAIDKFSAVLLYGPGQAAAHALEGAGGDANLNQFCAAECSKLWIAFPAAADAPSVGDWKVARGAQGPQWSYKGMMVFLFANDIAPDAVNGDNYGHAWQALAYVPAPPKIAIPHNVRISMIGESYGFTDTDGHVLYATTATGQRCDVGCTPPLPFNAPIAGRKIGDWTPVQANDGAQWAYRGALVYVSPETKQTPPQGGRVLRP